MDVAKPQDGSSPYPTRQRVWAPCAWAVGPFVSCTWPVSPFAPSSSVLNHAGPQTMLSIDDGSSAVCVVLSLFGSNSQTRAPRVRVLDLVGPICEILGGAGHLDAPFVDPHWWDWAWQVGPSDLTIWLSSYLKRPINKLNFFWRMRRFFGLYKSAFGSTRRVPPLSSSPFVRRCSSSSEQFPLEVSSFLLPLFC